MVCLRSRMGLHYSPHLYHQMVKEAGIGRAVINMQTLVNILCLTVWFLILEAPLTIFRDPDGHPSNLNTVVKSSLLLLWQGQGLKLLLIPFLWRGSLLVEHQQLLTVFDLHHHFLNQTRGIQLVNNLNPSHAAPFQAGTLSYQNLFTH